MTQKHVWQYRCEFCGKKGYSAGHMSRHEKHCTKNPSRICRVCKMIDETQKPIADLMAALPEALEAEEFIIPDWRLAELDHGMDKLRQLTACPACIMAALRQRGIPVPAVAHKFEFSKEMKDIWAAINEAQ